MQPKLGLWLVVSTFLLLAIAYALVVPPLEGFDARAYFRYAGFLHQERRLPTLDRETARYSYELIAQPPLYFAAIALATAPLPMAETLEHARQSENPYHDKSLSLRQTITLPRVAPGVWLTLWVARIVSLVGGLATVIGAWLLVRALLPHQPGVAVAVASIVGFNPQFLFTSVTITNDAWSPALCVLSLWLLARATRQQQAGWSTWLLVGGCAGLAALTKYSTLLIALPGLLLFWRYGRGAGWRRSLHALLWIAVGALLVAGPWYGRNWLLYGSPVPFDQMATVLSSMRRPQPMGTRQLIDTIPWLFTSYWGVFVSILAPPAYLNTTKWLMIIAAAGLLFQLVRNVFTYHALRPTPYDDHFALPFALLWFATIFAGVLHWTRTITFGEQGRLLHVAAPAFALLLLFGWRAWLPQGWQRWLNAFLPFTFVGLALWPLPTLRTNYSLPTPLTPPVAYDRELQATFASGMRVLGIDLPRGAAVAPGERLPLTLYFQTDHEILANYTLFLHLADAKDQLLAQFDGVPLAGRHPTRQWLPGSSFADRYTLTVRTPATSTLATLSLGFYDYADPTQRQPVMDRDQTVLGDRLILAQVRVLAATMAATPVSETAMARWQGGIQLLTAQVKRDMAGTPHSIHLQWQATETLHIDYTVFVQLLDRENRVIAQVDQQPQAGGAPTSTWRRGDGIADHYMLDPPIGPWQQLIVGLYDQGGHRLLLDHPQTGSDYFVLMEIEGQLYE